MGSENGSDPTRAAHSNSLSSGPEQTQSGCLGATDQPGDGPGHMTDMRRPMERDRPRRSRSKPYSDRKNWIAKLFTMSMKKAETSGSTTKASGEGP